MVYSLTPPPCQGCYMSLDPLTYEKFSAISDIEDWHDGKYGQHKIWNRD